MPWNVERTRTGSFTVAIGPAARFIASSTTRSLRFFETRDTGTSSQPSPSVLSGVRGTNWHSCTESPGPGAYTSSAPVFMSMRAVALEPSCAAIGDHVAVPIGAALIAIVRTRHFRRDLAERRLLEAVVVAREIDGDAREEGRHGRRLFALRAS